MSGEPDAAGFRAENRAAPRSASRVATPVEKPWTPITQTAFTQKRQIR
jgi:hypothetical protein